jgi:tetratricopeptide (TPR) repeat protein
VALTILLVFAGCSPARSARDREKEGILLLQEGRSEEARIALEDALESDPGLYEAAITLAAMYERAGDAPRALATLERLAHAKPGLGLAFMALGDLRTRMGDYDRALQDYARVIAIASHGPAYLRIAEIHEKRGEAAAAERALLAAIRAQPADADARYALAKLYDEHAPSEIAAREAWERYLAFARGDERAGAKIEEAKARLRVLSSRLTTEEKAAALAAAREYLRVLRPGVPLDEQALAQPAQFAALDRFFAGRVFLTLYLQGAPFVRGSGKGATLLDAIEAAAYDAKGSRTFDLFYGANLARARIALDLEAGEPEALAIAVATEEGAIPAGGFRMGEEAIEAERGGRRAILLPADQASRGLLTPGAAIRAAIEDLLGPGAGVPPDLSLKRLRTISFVEAADGVAQPLDLVGGLVSGRAPGSSDAIAMARAGARWLASPNVLGERSVAEGYDPIEDRYLRPVTATADHCEAALALAEAGRRLGDTRLIDAAALAFRALRGAGAPATALLRLAARFEDRAVASEVAARLFAAQRADGLFEGGIDAGGAALALAEAAPLVPAARPAAIRAVLATKDVPEPGPALLFAAALLLEGGGDPALETAAQRLAARAVERAAAAPAEAAETLEIAAAAARLPPKLRPPGAAAALARAALATATLHLDERSAYAFRDRGRAIGGFRAAPLDPRIFTREVARRVAALLAAAPALPEGKK